METLAARIDACARAALARLRAYERETPEEARRAVDELRLLARVSDLAEAESVAERLRELLTAGDHAEVSRLADSLEACFSRERPLSPTKVPGAVPRELAPDEQQLLRGFFREEAREHLEAADECLRDLERGEPHPESAEAPVARLLRALHTLKGAAGTVGLPLVTQATHLVEDGVARARTKQGTIPPAALTRLQAGLRSLRALVELHPNAPEGAARLAELVGQLGPARRRAPRPLRGGWPDDGALDPRPLTGTLAPEPRLLRVDAAEVDQLLHALGELVLDRTRIERRALELRALADELRRARNATRSLGTDVRLARPALAARVGDVEIGIAEAIRRLDGAALGLSEEAASMRASATAMQRTLQQVRVVPLRWLFQRAERLVAEAARGEGKQVELVTRGEAIELDRSAVEQLADPLLQLVRNAIAHGIEPPADRAAAGKPLAGRVELSARQRGELVTIDVSDDGRGIDPAVVRERLVATRRLDPAHARALDDQRAIAAIFQSGFTTRATADPLAGRGVGLDVVRERVTRLGGDVVVSSRIGVGTCFTVRLPLTTAIMQALLFKIGGQVYALPAAHVVDTKSVVTTTGPSIRLGPDELPLLDLHAELGAARPAQPTSTFVVLTFDERRFAVTCDKVIGPRQIVVKSIGPLLRPLPLYAGATISGAAKVQLLLDLSALAARALTAPGFPRSRASATHQLGRILVVDDSRSVREALSMLLSGAGYRVDAASDGWEAWETLQDGHYDLVLTDLEMPRLSGYDLIAKVRADADLRALPILVVSSQSGATSRERAHAAGAAQLIPKPIDGAVLLAAITAALER
jgi:chemotaxis protein histidine kinase CheA